MNAATLVDLLLGDPGALEAHGLGRVRRREQHVAVADELLGAVPSPASTRESACDEVMNAMRDGMFALMSPVTTSTRGRCVATTRWMPTARAICAIRQIASSTSRGATIMRSASSSITTTMNGRCSNSLLVPGRDAQRALAKALLVAVDVAHPDRREHLVAHLHLAHDPLRAPRRRASGARSRAMSRCGTSAKWRELDPLGVDRAPAAPRRAWCASGST